MKLGLEEKLYKAGLDKTESKIYSYLLGVKNAIPSKIALETNINRSTVYKALVRLSIKGIIGESKTNKKQIYFAEHPNKLKRYKKDQEKDVERQMSYVNEVFPQLTDLYNSGKNIMKSYHYEGKDIQKIYDDHVSYSNYELLAIVNIDAVKQFSPDHKYWKSYIKQKLVNKITTRGIVSDSVGVESITDKEYGKVPDWAKPKIKKLPISFFSFEGEYMIYGEDRVSITNLKEGQVSGVIIVDRMFSQMMRNFFDLVWRFQK